jgi:hypothetical protein
MRNTMSDRTAKRHWLETIAHSSEESLVTICDNWEGRKPADRWTAWQLRAIERELEARP